MKKSEFLEELRIKLSVLPENEVEKSVEFYSEMIDDRLEDGMTEDEATRELGDVGRIVNEVIYSTPLPKLIREKVRPKHKLSTLEWVLIILGSPIWLSIGIAFAACLIAVYVCMWSVAVAVWAVAAAFDAAAVACLVKIFFAGAFSKCLFLAGAALAFAGPAILTFIASYFITKAILRLSAGFGRWIKSLFIGKEKRK